MVRKRWRKEHAPSKVRMIEDAGLPEPGGLDLNGDLVCHSCVMAGMASEP